MTEPPPPAVPPLLLHRLRWRLFRNTCRTVFSKSALRPITAAFVSVLVAGLVFGVSLDGFWFLRDGFHLPLHGEFIGIFLDVFFLILAVMLVFSGGLILYGSLFTSPETAFLFSTPVPEDRVFAYKFQGATAFSSWAFLLLGGPLLIAYGIAAYAPWYYYLFVPVFFFGFVLLPASVGGLLCLLVVNFVPRQRKQVLIGCGAVVVAVAAYWIYQITQEGEQPNNRETFHRLLGYFSLARGALTPSHWAARGLQGAARGEVGAPFYYLALVWSNGLFAYLVAAYAAKRLYRRGFNRLATGGSLRRRYGGAWMDHALSACLPFVAGRTRLLVVKDFRTFRRDPQQWAQILLFVVPIVLSAFNLRRFYGADAGWPYQNFLSLLNLFLVGMLACLYNSRFVFPLLSLEGRKFWVLGLLPISRDQLLWGKFTFAATGSLLLGESLVLLSDLVLGMPWPAVALHVLATAVMALGLSGLSVGLGAGMPNFRERDPSKIVAGFGGTVNLVTSLLFLILVLLLLAVPWHLQMAVPTQEAAEPAWSIILPAAAAGLAVGALATLLPLRLGMRALRKMEF